MHLNTITAIVLAVAGSTAGLSVPREAVPEPAQYGDYYSPAQQFCTTVKNVIKAAGQQSKATAFCSSHLHVPKVTKTKTLTRYTATVKRTATVTSGVVTKTVATRTITATVVQTATSSATVTDKTTSIETVEAVSTSHVTACAAVTASPRKRAVAPVAKPGSLKKYSNSKALSSACKCLSIPKATTTTTKYITKPTTTTTTITVPSTKRATATSSATKFKTTTVTNTATQSSTIVEKSTTYTSTTYILAIPTFAIYAVGGDHDGSALYDEGNGYVSVGDDGGSMLEFTTTEEGVLQVLNGGTPGTSGGTDPNNSGSNAYVLFGAGLPEITCSATVNSDGTCPLTCQASRGSTSFDCGVYWRIGSDTDAVGCSTFSPHAVGSA